MKVWQIIQTLFAVLATTPWLAAQQFGPGGPPPATFSQPTAPPAANSQPYLQPAPVVVQPTPQGVPIYPPGSTMVPLPSQAPGSIFGPPPGTPVLTVPQPVVGPEQLPPPGMGIAPAGVAPIVIGPGAPMPAAMPGPANPISVPVVDDEFAWDQIADVVSDYFTIAREQRARRGGDGLAEGCIQTVPLTGATVLEPHRKDSVGSFNRWESTFQSIRRRATVRVIPDANGYLVEVIVEKELEDLPKPEKGTAGTAVFQSELSLPSKRLEEVSRTRQSMCWISLGRDPALEQRMLADIHARLNGITGSRVSLFQQ